MNTDRYTKVVLTVIAAGSSLDVPQRHSVSLGASPERPFRHQRGWSQLPKSLPAKR